MRSFFFIPFLYVCCFNRFVKNQIIGNNLESCQTPDGIPGQCIPIQSCEYLKGTLGTAPKPLNQQQIEMLHKYHCGFDGNTPTPKVCCPTSLTSNQNQNQNSNLNVAATKCGGKELTFSQFPWMVQFAYNSSNSISFKCAGTLITDRYVLTAAQCLTGFKSPQTLQFARLGEYDTSTNPDCFNRGCADPVQDVNIDGVYPHPEFNPGTNSHDIGLVRLQTPANFKTDSIRPICLPSSADEADFLSGKQALVAGWGATENGEASTKLRKVSLPIVEQTECKSRYIVNKVPVNLSERQICAGGVQGKDACSGDGGAPLILKNQQGHYVQYGIVSFGSRFCGLDEFKLPGVYTNVAKYLDWIQTFL